MEYRYPHFKRELLMEDAAWKGGPVPGEPFPEFELATTDGGRLTKQDLLGRPALITLGSFT